MAVKDDPIFFNALRDGQRAWVKIRNSADTKVREHYGEGTGAPTAGITTTNTITINKIELFIYLIELVEFADGPIKE
jgi:uncharacterized protein YecT (DUF1311 family)